MILTALLNLAWTSNIGQMVSGIIVDLTCPVDAALKNLLKYASSGAGSSGWSEAPLVVISHPASIYPYGFASRLEGVQIDTLALERSSQALGHEVDLNRPGFSGGCFI